MHKLGMSAKTVRRIHVRRAETKDNRRWQCNAEAHIAPGIEGFAIVVFDESIFIDDPAPGTKYWSLKGRPIVTTYKGRHGRVAAYGSIGIDGRQFFRTHDKFDGETVLKGNKDVKAIWLPAATPELSVMEEYWHQAKRDVLVSEYYGTVVQMRRAMSEHFRTARPGLDAMAFICRKSFDLKNF